MNQMQRSPQPTKICNGEDVLRLKDYRGDEREIEPCNGLCQPLISHYVPSSSEWFCHECRVSYGMTTSDYGVIAPTVKK